MRAAQRREKTNSRIDTECARRYVEGASGDGARRMQERRADVAQAKARVRTRVAAVASPPGDAANRESRSACKRYGRNSAGWKGACGSAPRREAPAAPAHRDEERPRAVDQCLSPSIGFTHSVGDVVSPVAAWPRSASFNACPGQPRHGGIWTTVYETRGSRLPLEPLLFPTCDSRSLTSAWSIRFTGTGTPSAAPRPAT